MYRKTRHYKGKQKDSLTSLNVKAPKGRLKTLLFLPISDKPEQIKTANIYIVTTTLPCNYFTQKCVIQKSELLFHNKIKGRLKIKFQTTFQAYNPINPNQTLCAGRGWRVPCISRQSRRKL